MNIRFWVLCFFSPILVFAQGQFVRTKAIADAFLAVRQYNSAIPYYKKCIKIAGDKDSVVYFLAHCYLQTDCNKEALKAHQYLLQQHPERDTLHFALAEMLKKNAHYAEAKKHFLFFQKKAKNPERVKELAASCDSAIVWRKQPHRIKIQNIGWVNTSFSEISPCILNNELLFSSDREEVIIRKKDGFSGAPSFDFYSSSKGSDSTWQTPKPFSLFLNSSNHETSCTFTSLGKMYLARAKPDKDNSMRLKLYSCEKEKLGWGKLNGFIFNDSLSSFAQPFVDEGDKLFFFVSDMPGGFGGTDIYVCANVDGKWTDPFNLGSIVNTKGNETYPFYSASDEKLYFSSDWHTGLGGQDIFVAEQKNGDWAKVANLKHPINSSADDFGFFQGKNKINYFSSNREGGKGKEDLYSYESVNSR